MNIIERRITNLKCEHATVQELETYPRLERSYWNYELSGYYNIYYRDNKVEMISLNHFTREKNYFNSVMELFESGLGKLDELKSWTILDTPNCAKIILEESIIPGVLMKITCDGDNASLVFFPMAMCCAWSKDPDSIYYDEIFIEKPHSLGNDMDWRERPFTEIFSKFEKGSKIIFVTFPNVPTRHEPSSYKDYFLIWKHK